MKRYLTIGAFALLAGCQSPGSARYVTRHADTGVVAVSSNSETDRARGLALIARHVGGQFVIEKEEVVMLSDESNRHRDRAIQTTSNPVANKTPQDVMALESKPRAEHRIHYRRSVPATATSSEPTMIQPASATVPMTIPVAPTTSSIPAPLPPSRETTPPMSGVKSFLPVTCEGCQGR